MKRILFFHLIYCSLLLVRGFNVSQREYNPAFCSTSTSIPCYLDCSSVPVTGFGRDLEQIVDSKLPNCLRALSLKIGSINYNTDFTLYANWFEADLHITELDIRIGNNHVEINAFSANAFKTIKKLTIRQLDETTLEKGVFNDLDVLEVLWFIENSNVKFFQEGILDSIKSTLEEFRYDGFSYSNPLLLDGITGTDAVFPKLRQLSVETNLKNTITSSTFKGLVALRNLDLSECKIETIGSSSFNGINEEIFSIDLSKNLLKTLPVGIFAKLLDTVVPNYNLIINLNSNSFNCNCDLQDFKYYLKEFPQNFKTELKCKTPPEYKDQSIGTTNFCKLPSPETTINTEEPTTLPTIGPSNPTGPTVPTENPDDFISEDCYDNHGQIVDVISIRRPLYGINITENDSGEVVIEFNITPQNYVLIWFDNNDPGDGSRVTYVKEFSCLFCNFKVITIPNIKSNSTYTFCLMHRHAITISPLNCASHIPKYYYEVSGYNIWISKDAKALTISLVLLGFIVCMIFGVIIGLIFLRKYPSLLRGHKRVVVVDGNIRSFSNAFSTKSDVMVMPPEWSCNQQKDNCVRPYRRFSDVSTASGRSYVTSVNPSRFDIIKMKLEKQQKQTEIANENLYYLENMPNLAPPPLPPLPPALPPQLPKRDSQLSTKNLLNIPTVCDDVDRKVLGCNDYYGITNNYNSYVYSK